jgi:hypothetical protein
MKYKVAILIFLMAGFAACNQPQKGESANGTTGVEIIKGVYFISPKDGDKVKSPVIVQMGVKGMEVEPAGALNENKGHHHLIIDGTFIEKGVMVPKDETHLHFGKGQTVDTLALSPGEHTLTLQFADGMHNSYGKDWSATIKITVEQ